MRNNTLSMAGVLAMIGAAGAYLPAGPSVRRVREWQRIKVTPAVDTGNFPRATKRRATRAERRADFRRAVAEFGSPRQARRETRTRVLEVI